jgi:hypothetical protein
MIRSFFVRRGAAIACVAALPLFAGCIAQGDDDYVAPGEETASTSAITDIVHSSVKSQAIGNCWIYATVSWAESLNKAATGQEADFSESYITYWHWFEQIVAGRASTALSTGGYYTTAAELINRYGLMTEGDFISQEASLARSTRQSNAEKAINDSIKSGALSTPAARANRATVRAELNRAWGLDATVVTDMDSVFGATVTKTIDRYHNYYGMPAGSKIKRAVDYPARLRDPRTAALSNRSLQDAIGASSFSGRTGRYAWNSVSFPRDAWGRRQFEKRIQRALHDKQPVIMSWFVDFNALETDGAFRGPPTEPGRQGGHMTVLEDYQVTNVPGFGTLQAGVLESRPQALQAALNDQATIEFWRMKNSWGNHKALTTFVESGYHDVYSAYIKGNVPQCSKKADQTTDPENCWDATPLSAAILPPGY